MLDSKNVSPIVVHAGVRSIEALEALEILHDGRVVASRELRESPSDPQVESELKFSLTAKRSGWIAARALYRAPDGLLRQAHTSPIYLSLDNKPIAVAEDARYMLRWLDQIEDIARSQPNRYPDADSKQAVLATYAKARQRYETIVATAQQE